MEILVGIFLALGIAFSSTMIGFDKDRSFYPVIMIVISLIYVLFSTMGDSSQTLIVVIGIAIVFQGIAVSGYKSSLWLVVLALAAHGIWDIFHGHFINNTGMPIWWPGFCSAYDITAALYLSWLLVSLANSAEADAKESVGT